MSKEHIDAIGVESLPDVSKGIWKRKIKKYIYDKQRKELLEDMSKYKKLNVEKLSNEPFERKAFISELNLENARMKYKILSSIVPSVRTHFSRKYRDKSLACPACSAKDSTDSSSRGSNRNEPSDTVEHILVACEEYNDIKDNDFDPMDDEMLTNFFIKVVNRRKEKGDD